MASLVVFVDGKPHVTEIRVPSDKIHQPGELVKYIARRSGELRNAIVVDFDPQVGWLLRRWNQLQTFWRRWIFDL